MISYREGDGGRAQADPRMACACAFVDFGLRPDDYRRGIALLNALENGCWRLPAGMPAMLFTMLTNAQQRTVMRGMVVAIMDRATVKGGQQP